MSGEHDSPAPAVHPVPSVVGPPTWSVTALNGAWWQLVALGVLYYVCVRTATGQVHENQLHRDALESRGSVTGWLGQAFDVVERLEAHHLVIGAVLIGVLGLVRGRPGKAAAGIVVAGGTLALTELLKLVLLERPDLLDGGYASNSLPSGHTAAVLGLALGALVAAPRFLRLPMTLLGAAAAGAMGAFVITDGWHRVSDVLASALVGSIVFCAVQVLPSRDRRARGALVSLMVTVPLACAAALVVVYAGAVSLTTAFVVAGSVVALTVLLAGRALPQEVR